MKRVHIAFFCSAVILLGLVAGCKKYEDGPTISLRSKEARLVNTWQAKYVFQDGIDYTVYFQDWNLDLREDGRIVITDLNELDSTVTQDGFWDLVNDKEDLRLLFTVPRVNPDRITYSITRLTKSELWYKEYTDSTTWEFRLIPADTTAGG